MDAEMAVFDSLVIGGGHNGLACAAYLARAGQRVAVIEARPVLGGFATSEHPFSNHPNVLMPMAAMDLATVNLPPSIIDDLDMRANGLRLIDVDPFYSYVAPDGTSIVFWRDIEKTCAEIARLSVADADAYRQFTNDMIAFWHSLAPYLHAHPIWPGIVPIAKMLSRAGRAPKKLLRAARIIMMSPLAVLDSTFESHALRSALANFAAASTTRLDASGSGIILAAMAMQHQWGVARPVGGMGAFVDTLVAIGKNHGVTYMAGAPVGQIIVEGGRATGVVLADGRQISATNVIGALDPITLMTKLLPSDALPHKLRSELKGLTVFSSNIGAARVDFLVQSKPEMVVSTERAAQLLPTSMLIGPSTLEATDAYINSCSEGRLEDDIPIWAASPSMLDRTLTPTPDQQCFYVYAPAVPLKLSGGQSWVERRDELGTKVLRQMETVMPGISSLVLARAIRTPDDLTRTSGLERGCLYHADMSLSQMGPWRPTPSLAGYRTPIPGLWHTGAGAHPMGSVNGISGKLTAQVILRQSRRR